MIASLSPVDTLAVAQKVQPLIVLTIYQHAAIMRRYLEDGALVEYPVDPEQIAVTLGNKQVFSTGLIASDVLWVGQSGTHRAVIGYRPPQLTGLWLEGAEDPVHVPLPGLLMRRSWTGSSARYSIYATTERPTSPDAVLYHAPLPNVTSNGTCWGTVAQPSRTAMMGSDLTPDWAQFMGSRFSNHHCNGKSQRYPKDIRKLYYALAEEKVYEFPMGDLCPIGTEANPVTIGSLMEMKS